MFFSQLEEDDACFVCPSSSVYSWANLDLRPTLLKGFTDTEEEREGKLIRTSDFSLRREPARWGPAGSFRGMVYRWVGGVVAAGDVA